MYEAEQAQWWYAGQRAIATALLAPALPGRDGERRLLDAGCGTGYNLLDLGRLGRATGVDLSAEAIAFCRARGVRAARASVLALPFADGTFDAVTSFDVIYHAWVSDDRAAVRELARVLRPGGALLVRVPALRALWGAHDTEVQSRHRYTRGELVALLEAAGLPSRGPPTATRSSSRSSSAAARSTASSRARAPTWASCPPRSSGPSARPSSPRPPWCARARPSRWGRASSPSRRKPE